MPLSLRLPVARSNFWSLADQALVSGSNFLCGILLARVLGLEAFGTYVVAQTYLLYASTFQSALVVSPMMTAVSVERNAEVRRSLLRGFLGYTLLVLAATGLAVQLLAWLLGRWAPAIGLGGLALPLAAAMAGFQLQDWLRRACYSESENRRVFLADSLAYGGQVSILLVLAWKEGLRPDVALWSLAAAFFASALIFLSLTRLWPSYRATRGVLRTHWRASRNFLVSWQLQWAGSAGIILLGTAMVGTQAAGAIRAVQNLLGPVNVAFQWMENVIPVRAAVRLRDGGRGALASYLWRLGVSGGLALGFFAGVLALVDEPLMVMLYGEEYRPFAILVVFQAFYYLFGHAYRMASYFRRALNETRELAVASAWWAAVALVVALLAVPGLADRGIMLALVLGEIAGLIYLLTRHRLDGAGGTHSVVRRRDGSVQLLLPVANRRLGRAALGMYFPSRWTGRLYRAFLHWSLPARLSCKIAELNSPAVNFPHLRTLLAGFPGLTPEYCGVLASAPGPHAKLTLKLMDETAAVHAYGRLAFGEKAIDAIRREASVLRLLQDRPVNAQVPRVLHHAQLCEPDAYCLVESAGPECPAEPTLSARHFEFLARLAGGGEVSWPAVVARLRQDISPVVAGSPAEALCLRACDVLARASIAQLPECTEHGDFAPWNIRRSGDGSLFFIDWEHAVPQGLPWIDALHFVYQMEVLVHRSSPLQVKEAMMSLFAADGARDYAKLFPMLKGQEGLMAVVYLLRMLVLGASEGKALDSKCQAARLRVLATWMDDLASEAR